MQAVTQFISDFVLNLRDGDEESGWSNQRGGLKWLVSILMTEFNRPAAMCTDLGCSDSKRKQLLQSMSFLLQDIGKWTKGRHFDYESSWSGSVVRQQLMEDYELVKMLQENVAKDKMD